MIHQGKLQLVINALQKELAIAIRNHQPIYSGKAALFWQDSEIWDVMDCGGLMKWNSQGENTKESEEHAGNGNGGAMEKKQETEEEAMEGAIIDALPNAKICPCCLL